jgi:hypothetical protein
MPQYDPLRDYLRKQTLHEIVLSFKEIEQLISLPLPTSATRPQWWENATDPNTSHAQCKAWRSAGYKAFLIAGSKKVRFEKDR